MRFELVLWLSAGVLGSAPLLMALHKLIPESRSHLRDGNAYAHNESSVLNTIKNWATQCLLDAYILIDQPGLTYEDLLDYNRDSWPFLRRYVTLSSLIVGLSWLQTPPDFDHIESYIVRTCEAEAVRVDGIEGPDYYDVRKRVFRVRLRPLPQGERRESVALENDEIIRKILRKLPSPHYTILMSSTNPGFSHPIPPAAVEAHPERFEIFNEISHHPSRASPVERNNNFHAVEPHWIENRHTNERYLRNRDLNRATILDIDHWTKYAKLVLTILLTILSLALMKVVRAVHGWISPSKVHKKD